MSKILTEQDFRDGDKPRRKQKRYEDEFTILASINEATRQANMAVQEGLFHQKMSEKYLRDAAKEQNGAAAFYMEKADEEHQLHNKCIKRAERIEYKLTKLKEALAAFRTVDMFGDQGTVIQ